MKTTQRLVAENLLQNNPVVESFISFLLIIQQNENVKSFKASLVI